MTKASGIIACVLLGLTSLALPACSGKSDGGTPSKEDQCKAYLKVDCDKAYECLTAAQRAQLGGQLGTSKEDCPAALEAANPCSQDPCKPGQTYNSAKATECTDALSAAACADLSGGADGPAACKEVCTGDATPNDSGGGDSIAECKKLNSLQCHKIFACATAEQLAAAVDSVGKDETECATIFEADTPCTADALCGAGTFDATQVDSCNAALTAQTCDDFTAATGLPPECDALCPN
ncbi:MAG: hypothetical protein ABJB12_12440 [Pseudomonadota bacterium]